MKVERLISYAGSKAGLYHLYPAPKHNRIIEPFACGAGYSLAYWDRDVTLYEIDDAVYSVWEYLKNASKKDIMSLPEIGLLKSVEDYNLSEGEKNLIGFWLCGASGKPAKYNRSAWTSQRPKWFWGAERKKKIADDLYKIKHWNIIKRDWEYAFNGDRNITYFIDPPYIIAGKKIYNHHQLKYGLLAQYINEDKYNQMIVCEGPEANWLPFERLDKDAQRNRSSKEIALSKEYVYTI